MKFFKRIKDNCKIKGFYILKVNKKSSFLNEYNNYFNKIHPNNIKFLFNFFNNFKYEG